MTAAEIATEIGSVFDDTVKMASLFSILSRLIVKHDTFTRPKSGVYGLIEWEKRGGATA